MASTIGRACLIVALGVALSAAPGRAAQIEAGEAVVDASYQTLTMELKDKRDRLLVWLKAEPQDGNLKVCGAYLAMMPEDRFAQIESWLGDLNTHMVFGSKSGRGQTVRPSFLVGRRFEGGAGPIRRSDERTATCVLTDAAWEDRFAQDPYVFRLRETQFKRSILRQ
jgi:hypothetical protein